MICGSSASTLLIWLGKCRRLVRCMRSAAGGKRPRSLASVSVSKNSAANWVVNALVEATPISVPARVR